MIVEWARCCYGEWACSERHEYYGENLANASHKSGWLSSKHYTV